LVATTLAALLVTAVRAWVSFLSRRWSCPHQWNNEGENTSGPPARKNKTIPAAPFTRSEMTPFPTHKTLALLIVLLMVQLNCHCFPARDLPLGGLFGQGRAKATFPKEIDEKNVFPGCRREVPPGIFCQTPKKWTE
jgi:hypothetical protein